MKTLMGKIDTFLKAIAVRGFCFWPIILAARLVTRVVLNLWGMIEQ